MKQKLLLLFTTLLCIHGFAQISYEKGYYIDTADQKIVCLIKNMEWRNNPTSFEIKTTENSEPIVKTIKNVKEFGIDNNLKYIRSSVKIDVSTDNVNDLSFDKNPVFKEEAVFLKVLVAGSANLYQYVDGNLTRYFYSKAESPIEPLIYKRYRTNTIKMGVNNGFKQQLYNDLKCNETTMKEVENLGYNSKDLIKFFVAYNRCTDPDYINYESKEKRDFFNLTVRPRFNTTSFSIHNDLSTARDTDFGNKMGIGLGMEAEFVFPFNKNKWAIIVEPTYQSFKSEKTTPVKIVLGGELIAKVHYSSVELPLGLRHYFFLNEKSKIFINASFVFDKALKKTLEFNRNDGTTLDELAVETSNNFAFGAGFKQNNRYSIEVRYQTKRDLLVNYSYWSSEYNTFSIILGYSIF